MHSSEWIGERDGSLLAVRLTVDETPKERRFSFELTTGERLFYRLLPPPGMDLRAGVDVGILWDGGEYADRETGIRFFAEPGSYDVTVVSDDRASYVFVAGVLSRLRNRQGWRSFVQCELCVQSIKAGLVGALGPVALAADVPDEIIEAAIDGLDWLAEELGVPVDWLKSLLRQVRNLGIDRIAERICNRMGLCPV